MSPTAEQLIADKLRTLAPMAKTHRIWGRMDATEYERVHGTPMTQAAGDGAAANAWAADPEDLATEIVAVLRAARLLADPAKGEGIYGPVDESKDTWT